MSFTDRPYLREIQLKRDNIDSFEVYPFNIPAIRELDYIEFHADVTFFVGENGAGKSTLIEAIAVAMGFNAEGGTKQSTFTTNKTHSSLYEYLKPIKSFKHPRDGYFLRAESFYNLATLMDEVGYLSSYGGKSLHQQSHGESFMATLVNKLRGDGLYIMDEPEAALSPARQMAAVSAIHQLVEENSQFIIATHSPILLAYPRAKIYQFSQTGISEVKYEDTEHYTITKDFLNHHEQMMKVLMEE
ncbi:MULTISPECIES: AAA family ATPase [Pseudoalteromonas]|uniref:AAA family ATPase n=1 Tax=Pseudoalteromonas obscura TaxID=3048491 RepID=A0ABT7EL06_9GAMM|nr:MULTISPECIES: AAA family ATPase [Pseudoalteromonas]MBQ4837699.1 AAA family ATPase [Pseudoalteromonas luteoviolacea]MDK2595723.1 AAA family ATPase [Pseudoalteromonas sp. P94(2023)]